MRNGFSPFCWSFVWSCPSAIAFIFSNFYILSVRVSSASMWFSWGHWNRMLPSMRTRQTSIYQRNTYFQQEHQDFFFFSSVGLSSVRIFNQSVRTKDVALTSVSNSQMGGQCITVDDWLFWRVTRIHFCIQPVFHHHQALRYVYARDN